MKDQISVPHLSSDVKRARPARSDRARAVFDVEEYAPAHLRTHTIRIHQDGLFLILNGLGKRFFLYQKKTGTP